jgi:HEPN domain-containing protein
VYINARDNVSDPSKNGSAVTLRQVLSLARQLSPVDKVRVIERIAPEIEREMRGRKPRESTPGDLRSPPLDRQKRKTLEGWIDTACTQLRSARDHLGSRRRYAACIEAAQECIELSVKAVLSLLAIEFEPRHAWNGDELASIAEQIQRRHLLETLKEQHLDHCAHLPRLLLLMNLWGPFYVPAKYGFEAGHLAPAEDLCGEGEAELALQHAAECHAAASELRHLSEERLAALLGDD